MDLYYFLLPDRLFVCVDSLLDWVLVSFAGRFTVCRLVVDSVLTDGEAELLRVVFAGLTVCVDEELTFAPDLLPEPVLEGLLCCF